MTTPVPNTTKEGTTAEQEGTTAEQEGTTAEQEGTTAEQEGTTAEQEGTTAEQETTQQQGLNLRRRAGSRALNDGEWVSQTQEKYTGDQTIFTEGALTDPACSARSLQLDPDNYHQEGLILQCTNSQVDTTGPNPVINAPNVQSFYF